MCGKLVATKLLKSCFLFEGRAMPTSSGQWTPSGQSIMCAYKLCKVEFRYWGMQSKIERFIHDMALRNTMLRAHRQVGTFSCHCSQTMHGGLSDYFHFRLGSGRMNGTG